MAIIVVCSGCQSKFRISESMRGKRGRCPRCSAPIAIPDAVSAPQPPASQREVPQPSATETARRVRTPPPMPPAPKQATEMPLQPGSVREGTTSQRSIAMFPHVAIAAAVFIVVAVVLTIVVLQSRGPDSRPGMIAETDNKRGRLETSNRSERDNGNPVASSRQGDPAGDKPGLQGSLSASPNDGSARNPTGQAENGSEPPHPLFDILPFNGLMDVLLSFVNDAPTAAALERRFERGFADRAADDALVAKIKDAIDPKLFDTLARSLIATEGRGIDGEYAADIIHHLGDPRAVASLAALAQHEGHFGDTRADAPLDEPAEYEDTYEDDLVHERLIRALSGIHSRESAALLLRVAGDWPGEIKEILLDMEDVAVPVLCDAVGRAPSNLLFSLLEQFDDPRVVDTLINHIDNADTNLRQSTMNALVNMDASRTIPRLIALFKTGDESTKLAMLGVMDQIKDAPKEEIETLRTELARTTGEVRYRLLHLILAKGKPPAPPDGRHFPLLWSAKNDEIAGKPTLLSIATGKTMALRRPPTDVTEFLSVFDKYQADVYYIHKPSIALIAVRGATITPVSPLYSGKRLPGRPTRWSEVVAMSPRQIDEVLAMRQELIRQQFMRHETLPTGETCEAVALGVQRIVHEGRSRFPDMIRSDGTLDGRYLPEPFFLVESKEGGRLLVCVRSVEYPSYNWVQLAVARPGDPVSAEDEFVLAELVPRQEESSRETEKRHNGRDPLKAFSGEKAQVRLKTLEAFGRFVFDAVRSGDREEFLKSMIAEEGIRAICRWRSKLLPPAEVAQYLRRQEESVARFRRKYPEEQKKFWDALDTVRQEAKTLGIDWARATFERVEAIDLKRARGMEQADGVLIYFQFDRKTYQLSFSDSGKTPIGWRTYRPKIRLYPPDQLRNRRPSQ